VVSLFPCWSETFIAREIRGLLRQGVEIDIVSLKHPASGPVHAEDRPLLPRVLYPPRTWRLARPLLRELLRNPRLHARILLSIFRGLARTPITLAKTLVVWARTLGLMERVRATDPALLHAHWATFSSTAALILGRALGLPFGFTAHAHDIFVEDQLLAEKLEAAGLVITISDFNAAYLRDRYGSLDKLRVVRCGIDLPDFPYRSEGREETLLLAVGRLDDIKGFPYLVEACARLRDRSLPFSCHIVGSGERHDEIRNQIRARHLEDRVHLRGALTQQQLQELLGQAGVFVLPSVVAPDGNRDGIPVALMEAMASGLPVVSTTVSGIPELITDEKSGLLVPPGDPERLAASLERLLTTAGLGQRLARSARTAIEERFNLELESRRLLQLFRQTVVEDA